MPYHLKCGTDIYIHPIKVKDWSLFEGNIGILKLPKNEINDIEIMQMSYLQYLTEVVFIQSPMAKDMLGTVLMQSLHEDDIRIGYEKNKPIIIVVENEVIKAKIKPKEFDEISNIILNYNIKDYDNRYISPEVRKLKEDYDRLTASDKLESPSLEKQKAYVSSKNGMLLSQINDMSYREFSFVFDCCVDSEDYIAEKIIQGSYKYDVKENIYNPLFVKKQDPYEKIFASTESLNGKGLQGNISNEV